MNKAVAFILILIVAPFLGAVYGIIHDQLTYTISEEYFTKFKFVQFGLHNWGLGKDVGTEAPEILLDNPRLGTSIVGALATWWVGLIIGIILGTVGLIHKNGKIMFSTTVKAFMLTVGIALITGIIGLAYGKLVLTQNLPNWYLPKNLINIDHFIMVGSMHNFSYLGGLIGLIVALFYTVYQKNKIIS